MNMFVKTVQRNSKWFVRSVRPMQLLRAAAVTACIPNGSYPHASVKVVMGFPKAAHQVEAVIVAPAGAVHTAVIRTGNYNG